MRIFDWLKRFFKKKEKPVECDHDWQAVGKPPDFRYQIDGQMITVRCTKCKKRTWLIMKD